MGKHETAIRELTRLRAVTKARDEGEDWSLSLTALAEGLGDLSDAAIEAGCRSWAAEEKWFPSLAELRQRCVESEPRSSRPALPKPPERSRAEIDKRWWYERCSKHGDRATLTRARELYPDMFWEDGTLVPPNMVAFGQDTRKHVPLSESRAYDDADADVMGVLKRFAKSA